MPPSKIVYHPHRPKRPPKRATKVAPEPMARIVTASKPGKVLRRSEPVDDGPLSPELAAFFARMIRPPGT